MAKLLLLLEQLLDEVSKMFFLFAYLLLLLFQLLRMNSFNFFKSKWEIKFNINCSIGIMC